MAAQMVFPLTALFFGTGNQTPNVSATRIAQSDLFPLGLEVWQLWSVALLMA